ALWEGVLGWTAPQRGLLGSLGSPAELTGRSGRERLSAVAGQLLELRSDDRRARVGRRGVPRHARHERTLLGVGLVHGQGDVAGGAGSGPVQLAAHLGERLGAL